MKKQIFVVMLLIFVCITKTYSQNFSGYRSSNYLGVNGVFFNPANIADSRYKWDINLFSVNGFVGNNRATFNINDFSNPNYTSLKNKFLQGNGNTNANVNAEILGPSVMFNLSKKSSIAFTSRARVVANLKDFDGNLINSVLNATNATAAYSLTTNSNSRLINNGWGELGISYAREIASNGPHYFKAGITVKYLSGSSNNYIQVSQFRTSINADSFSRRAYMENSSGIIGLGNSGIASAGIKFNKLFGYGNIGIGGDIGFIYEYRPNFPASDSKVPVSHLNKYKLKIGLSLLDIGSIKYKTNADNSGSYNIHINGTNRFYLDMLTGKEIKQIKAILDANPTFFTNTANVSGSYNASLPTVLQSDVDYHLNKGFYINLNGQLNLISKANIYGANQYNSITLTPRYEGKSFGVYLPVNYNELTQFNVGLALRAGPLFVGSGSLFKALANSKQTDVYMGIRIGNLNKIKKIKQKIITTTIPEKTVIIPSPDRDGDGINDAEDKCPDVAGIVKYQGCPIPDTDGDGINDEEDKCPAVKGVAKYQGCPIPDTDGDGINDEEDKCPAVKGVAKYQGCPIPDTDGDGINDEEDKCPAVAGLASNMGCPVIEKAVREKVNFAASKIFFSVGSTNLLAKSFKSLDGVATLLKADTTYKMDIDGYTDNTGSPENNLLLSQQRAASVKIYLISKGVAESNLKVTGYGVEKPVASNKTPAGRSRNRRVELTIRNY